MSWTTTTPWYTATAEHTHSHAVKAHAVIPPRVICLRPNYHLNYYLLNSGFSLLSVSILVWYWHSMFGDPNLIGTLKTADHGVLIRISSWQYIPLWPSSLNMVYGGSCCLALQVSLYGHVMHLRSKEDTAIHDINNWESLLKLLLSLKDKHLKVMTRHISWLK